MMHRSTLLPLPKSLNIPAQIAADTIAIPSSFCKITDSKSQYHMECRVLRIQAFTSKKPSIWSTQPCNFRPLAMWKIKTTYCQVLLVSGLKDSHSSKWTRTHCGKWKSICWPMWVNLHNMPNNVKIVHLSYIHSILLAIVVQLFKLQKAELTSILHYHLFNTCKWRLVQKVQTTALREVHASDMCALFPESYIQESLKLNSDPSDMQEGNGFIRYTFVHLICNIMLLTGDMPLLNSQISTTSIHVTS